MQKLDILPTQTIAEARSLMKEKLKEGFICPCCSSPTRMYSRSITSSMAFGLILLYKAPSDAYVHIENYFRLQDIPASIRGDIPKLRFWSLIEPEGKEAEDKNPNNGCYRITELGKSFVEGTIPVPSHVNIYNNKMFGYSDGHEMIYIMQALKNKFKYKELMEG